MKQYRKLVETILEKGTYKEPARDGMPGSLSYFGYQFRHNLAEGFPLLTTKKLSFKNIVVELLWFLRGDTNVKYLVDNGCNIWNEDAYHYYVKKCLAEGMYAESKRYTFEEFINAIKNNVGVLKKLPTDYILGDCGKQYGWLWRKWTTPTVTSDWDFNGVEEYEFDTVFDESIDQLQKLIDGLKTNPLSRRHIITAWNPATLDDMALNACHAFVQFNCRPLSSYERIIMHNERYKNEEESEGFLPIGILDERNIPKYYLDCQMYQRSADVFLGVPFNIASYSLLTHILAKLCNMIPGEFIHTFGDAHIYDNHQDQIKEQLTREEKPLPKLLISPWLDQSISEKHFENDLNEWIHSISPSDFGVDQYDPHPPIKGKLSTGLK